MSSVLEKQVTPPLSAFQKMPSNLGSTVAGDQTPNTPYVRGFDSSASPIKYAMLGAGDGRGTSVTRRESMAVNSEAEDIKNTKISLVSKARLFSDMNIG